MQARITKIQNKLVQALAGIVEEGDKVLAVQDEASASSNPVHVSLPCSGVGKAS